MSEKIYRVLLAIPIAFSTSIIALFCFFCIGLSKVEAATWMQFNDTDNNYICGSSGDIVDCTYGSYTNGSYNYKKIKDYLIILEDLESMKANNTYEIELTWTLKTYALNNNETAWITRNNYSSFTSYTQMNLQTANGQLVDDSTKAWSLVGWSLTGTAGTNSSYANLAYNYSNTFTPKSDTDRIVLRITKRDRWQSIGTYVDFYGVSPEIELTNLTYTIRNISSSNQDVITNANQNTQDIINNNNQNTDKITQNQDKNQQQTNEGLQDIEDAITDESSPSLDSFNNMTGWLPPGPLDSVLNLPLNVLNGFVNVFNNGTCASVYLPLPFLDSDLEIPCIYSIYSQIDGLNIFLTSIFTAITGYLMFKYLCNLYVWIDDRLKMKESDYMSDWGGV